MLSTLRLQNYRGFDDHTIPLRPFTILVGQNNAGKSTVVEALRFLSIVTARYRSLSYGPAPKWSAMPRGSRGVAPALSGLEFSWDGLCHRYQDPPALIHGTFDDGATIEIALGSNEAIHAVLKNPVGEIVKDRTAANSLGISRVATMPQVGPLSRSEVILSPDYVRRAADSHLAPLHFRNQLHVINEHFRQFKTFSEDTWPGLVVRQLEIGNGLPGTPISLLVRDRDFVAETASMGHGLQVWLQTIWFLSRTSSNSTVVLDEPDVYLHADLQRRLIRLLRNRYSQVVVATHSLEILSEVDPEDVCVVERKRSSSSFVPSLPAVQRVIEQIGSIHNIQLARLWRARKCLLVEGADLDFLAHFQNTLYPQSGEPLKGLPHLPIGGWSGWPQAVGLGRFLNNVLGEAIRGLCVLDRDYRTPEEVTQRESNGARAGLWVHVWERKEIENYLLVPAAIQRSIAARAAKRRTVPTEQEVSAQLDRFVEASYDEVVHGIAEAIQESNRGLALKTAIRRARDRVSPRWKGQDRLLFVPGKKVLSNLSDWSQSEFGVGISSARLAGDLRKDEMPAELVDVMAAIETPVALRPVRTQKAE